MKITIQLFKSYKVNHRKTKFTRYMVMPGTRDYIPATPNVNAFLFVMAMKSGPGWYVKAPIPR